MTLKHQYTSSGKEHRVVELDIAGFLKVAGEWTANNIASYIINGNIYIALANEAGVLKADTIYQLTKTDFTSEKKV